MVNPASSTVHEDGAGLRLRFNLRFVGLGDLGLRAGGIGAVIIPLRERRKRENDNRKNVFIYTILTGFPVTH
ncbi:hypothetical protein HN51_017004 [Arachis hypogaea]